MLPKFAKSSSSVWLTRVFYQRTVQSHLNRQLDAYEITLKR